MRALSYHVRAKIHQLAERQGAQGAHHPFPLPGTLLDLSCLSELSLSTASLVVRPSDKNGPATGGLLMKIPVRTLDDDW